MVVSTQFEKYSVKIVKIKIFPQVGFKRKNVWNHHLVMLYLPTPPKTNGKTTWKLPMWKGNGIFQLLTFTFHVSFSGEYIYHKSTEISGTCTSPMNPMGKDLTFQPTGTKKMEVKTTKQHSAPKMQRCGIITCFFPKKNLLSCLPCRGYSRIYQLVK